ncbi:MAG: VanW family protein [Elainella sp.]
MLDALDAAVAYPSRAEQVAFRVKVTLFQLRRGLINWLRPVRRYRVGEALAEQAVVAESMIAESVIAESVTALWTSHEAGERDLIAGKIHNLRLAVQAIHGIELPAGATFSFWAQVGCPTRRKGYVDGRELRQGCVVPSVGGGLCQLSNALYSAALDAGLEIVERHAHTRIIPGSLAEVGRDATVFWNYVDLRFKTARPLRIEAVLTGEALVVRFRGQSGPVETAVEAEEFKTVARPLATSQSCLSCGVTACSRSRPQVEPSPSGLTAYLLDEYWPEFDAWIQQQRQATDLLAIPLDGNRWHKPNYAWTLNGFSSVKQARRVTFRRALASRRLAAQGSARQQMLLNSDRRLAQFYAAQLDYRILHCVVAQTLLPFLWQSGALGGRSFDVLMTRLPLFALQAELDRAYQAHPASPTLNDFRVDPTLVEAERQALEAAHQIVTPHRAIASLYPQKTILLDWQLPPAPAGVATGTAILFPASTLGRKGAYELRQAAQTLGLKLRVLGQPLEGDDFWNGVTLEPAAADPLSGVGLVVLPAYVEHRPLLLLRAVAAGVPVIASEACGLGELRGVISVATGDAAGLQAALAEFCRSTS